MDENEYRLEHAKFSAWERDAFNRLFYGLWVIFLGGFVLSLHVTVERYTHVAFVFVVVFRFLAIAGTALNFVMQYCALIYLGAVRELVFYSAYSSMATLHGTAREKAEKYAPIVKRCEKWSIWIAAVFLSVAFAGSFLVHIP